MKTVKSPIQSIRRYFAYTAASGIAIAAMGLAMNPSTQAQTCRSLEDLGGGGAEITKSVSLPPLGVGLFPIRSNWHTDFVVPGGNNFQYFVATILPIDSARYDIDVNLKYSDDTLDQAYTARNADLTEGEPLRVRADTRPGDTPFQVNVRVGGLQAEGNTYTVSVVGCR